MEAVNLFLLKAENPAAYKALANKGMMVAFPATIKGQTHRPDIDTHYHATVKYFDTDKDTMEQVHGVAHKLPLQPPDPKKTKIEPGVLKDRFGNDVYVIKLHGPDSEKMKEHNGKFDHLGFKNNYQYQPHVSVDKNTWQHIVNSKAQTAHEAGIDFKPAQLVQGEKVLYVYEHKNPLDKSEDLDKSFKGALTGLATAGMIATATPTEAMKPVDHQPKAGSHTLEMTKLGPVYDRAKMLRTIAQVESNNGKNTEHKPMGGMHHGETAYGKYGLTPVAIRETINLNKDLKAKHGKATLLDGNDLKNYVHDNPGLEDLIAEKHLARLEHHFGKDPGQLGFAWLNGVSGTYKAKKENKDINSHWHAKKIIDEYNKATPTHASR